MSAAPALAPDWTHPSEGRDREQTLSLFDLAAEEQQARWHTIQLLSDYLASGTARKRTIIAKELEACRQLYEAVWVEMSCAFAWTLLETTRQTIERPRNQ